MKYRLGSFSGTRKVIHVHGCPLGKHPYKMLDGLETPEEIIDGLGASIAWHVGCARCWPELHHAITKRLQPTFRRPSTN